MLTIYIYISFYKSQIIFLLVKKKKKKKSDKLITIKIKTIYTSHK